MNCTLSDNGDTKHTERKRRGHKPKGFKNILKMSKWLYMVKQDSRPSLSLLSPLFLSCCSFASDPIPLPAFLSVARIAWPGRPAIKPLYPLTLDAAERRDRRNQSRSRAPFPSLLASPRN